MLTFKKSLSVVVAVFLIICMSVTSVVFADAQNPNINITGPSGTLEVTGFPYDTYVTGTFDSPQIKDLTLYVNGSFASAIGNLNGNESGGIFSLPWEISAPGTYTLLVEGTHGNQDSSDTRAVTVALVTTTITVDYPAAPSVANKLLKSATSLGKNKNKGAVISAVAHYMGPGTDFNGVHKNDVAAYEAAVKAYLIKLGVKF